MNAIKLIAAALTLACASPAIAADYVPYIKANKLQTPSAEAPELKETGLTNGVFYMVKANDIATKAAIFTGGIPTGEDAKMPEYWDVTCFRDRMTDEKTCAMHKGDFGISYHGDSLAGSLVGILTPADSSGIETRVAKQHVMHSDPTENQVFSDAQARAVVNGLLAKETVLIRYRRKSDGVVTMIEVKPAAFEEAANYMIWRYHHM